MFNRPTGRVTDRGHKHNDGIRTDNLAQLYVDAFNGNERALRKYLRLEPGTKRLYWDLIPADERDPWGYNGIKGFFELFKNGGYEGGAPIFTSAYEQNIKAWRGLARFEEPTNPYRVLGFLYAEALKPDILAIYGFGVKPKARGKGVGRRLVMDTVETAVCHAEENGYSMSKTFQEVEIPRESDPMSMLRLKITYALFNAVVPLAADGEHILDYAQPGTREDEDGRISPKIPMLPVLGLIEDGQIGGVRAGKWKRDEVLRTIHTVLDSCADAPDASEKQINNIRNDMEKSAGNARLLRVVPLAEAHMYL